MTQAGGELWSAPDGDGIVTCRLDVGAASTLRGRRRRKALQRQTGAVGLWPAPWRDLLRDWLRGNSARRKWSSLLQAAGNRRVPEAYQLLDSLLKAGWVEIEERRKQGRWEPAWVDFPEFERLREQLGLPNRDKQRQALEAVGTVDFDDLRLQALQASLARLPAERALRRHRILAALDEWLTEERCGTRRDFALLAAGDTKGLSAADWDWLGGALDLAEAGIQRHAPALWLRAPLIFRAGDFGLDLRAVPDCLGLSPRTIDILSAAQGQIERWRVLENRTSFERAAGRFGERDGVLWVPGFAPGWWLLGVEKLLDLCPAPALIACDPDPAGIEIALRVGALWHRRGLSWEPWGMDPAALADLRHRKPLTEADRLSLARLKENPLPEPLGELAAWMERHQEKGEQEGIPLA